MDKKPKEKFIVKDTLDNYQYNINYDIDNNLIKPLFNTKEKNSKQLDNNLDFYYSTQINSAGRGFGDINVFNNIHYGMSSRNNNVGDGHRIPSSGLNRFQYIDSNIQNPNRIIMNDLPRGGIVTRKNISLKVDNMRPTTFNQTNDIPIVNSNMDSIEFDYS